MDALPQILVNSIIAGSLYAISALGFNIIYGATKFINMSHGVYGTIGAYSVFYFVSKFGMNTSISIVLALCIGALCAYLSNKLVFKPLRKKKSSSLVLFVASLGTLIAIQGVLALFFTSQFHTLPQTELFQTAYNFGSAYLSGTQIGIIVISFIAYGVMLLVLKKTHFGKTVQAINDDEEVAKIVGIHTEKIISGVFMIGGVLASLAAVLFGFDLGVYPTMGLAIILTGATASIIGGIGNISGGVIGAFMLGFAENFGTWGISGEWKGAIALSVLILFLMFRPQGLFGKK